VKVARLGDATLAEINQAKLEWEEATKAAKPWMVLMDVLAASRLDSKLQDQVPGVYEDWCDNPNSILDSDIRRRARKVLGTLEPRLNQYPNQVQAIPTPSVRTGVREDVYLSLVRI